MHFLPGMEGVSMEKPFVDCMRDVWALFEGPAMLALRYDTLVAAVVRLKKSAYARLQETAGKSKKDLLSLNIVLGTDEHDRAMLTDTAVRSFHDKLISPLGRQLTKKQLVESMVIYNFLCWNSLTSLF